MKAKTKGPKIRTGVRAGLAGAPTSGVMLNPIYQDAGTSASNPLWPGGD
jgi:hypothetical protein